MANECDVLERKPTEIDLADVAKVSGGNWKRLLTYLGVPYNQMVAFHANSSQNVQNACFNGLMYWHKGNAVVDGGPSPVTYSKLLQSMEDAEMRSMAEEKREKIIIKQYKPVVNTLQPSPGDVLERKPTETDLADVANVSGGNWKRLLTYLGVPYNKTVTFLVSSNQKVNDACFEGLMYWSEGNAVVDGEPSPVTYSKLLNSMEDADMRSTAEEMRKKIVKQYKPVVNTLQPSPGVPHEAVLSRNCWIPFDHDSITVDRQGGTYDLCSDGLTKLTVRKNAVRDETAVIRYAIIGRGPFQLPPNYQLGSFVVYVHYNPEEIITPVILSLPSWYGGDVVPGEPPPDGLSFAVAPHTLGLRDNLYTFQLVDGGEFRENRVHDVSIDGHSSLYAIAFKEDAKSLYLTTHLMVKNNAEETTYRIYVTYSSPTWSMILKAVHERVEFNVDHGQQFYFQKPSSDSPSGKLVCEVKDTTGNGWAVAIFGCPELRQTEVCYEQCGYATAEELESAVKEGLYPPNLTLTVVNNVGREEHPTPKFVNCTIRGADRPLQFPINVWERRDPPSPNPPTPSLYNKTPSDVALNDVLKIVPEWNGLVIKLGVPISKVHALQTDPMGGLLALQYWRDGMSGKLFPTTWKFLLDTVTNAKGHEVAQRILEEVKQNKTLWCMS